MAAPSEFVTSDIKVARDAAIDTRQIAKVCLN